MSRQSACVRLPWKCFRRRREAEQRQRGFIHQQPERRAVREAGADAERQRIPQRSVRDTGRDAERPVNRRADLLSRVVRQLAAGESRRFLRRDLVRRLVAARGVLALADILRLPSYKAVVTASMRSVATAPAAAPSRRSIPTLRFMKAQDVHKPNRTAKPKHANIRREAVDGRYANQRTGASPVEMRALPC